MTANQWRWVAPILADVPGIISMAQHQYWAEAGDVFTGTPEILARNLTISIVRQYYDPAAELIQMAVDDNNRLMAYIWAERGQRTIWSDDEIAGAKIIEMDLTLPTRTRIRLLNDMIDIMEAWALDIGVPIVCSATIRHNQSAFLRLHQRRGYDCRGSICYRRLPQQHTKQPTNHSGQDANQ